MRFNGAFNIVHGIIPAQYQAACFSHGAKQTLLVEFYHKTAFVNSKPQHRKSAEMFQ